VPDEYRQPPRATQPSGIGCLTYFAAGEGLGETMDDAKLRDATEQVNSLPRLRWYQFRLRSLLIFVAIVAIFCSWYAVKKRQADRQKSAVAELRRHGYAIEYDYEHFATQRSYDIPIPAPAWIVNLVGKDFLYDVYGVGGPISLIARYPLPALIDDDLTVLARLPNLRRLDFSNVCGNPAKITDEGLSQLANLKALESLDLSNTQVTDAGLKHIQGLPRLTYLCLLNTQVTEAAIQELQKSHPELEIRYRHLTGGPTIPYEWSEEERLPKVRDERAGHL
jgi:hypothetical protein